MCGFPRGILRAFTRLLPICTERWNGRSAADGVRLCPNHSSTRASPTVLPAWPSSMPPWQAPRRTASGLKFPRSDRETLSNQSKATGRHPKEEHLVKDPLVRFSVAIGGELLRKFDRY